MLYCAGSGQELSSPLGVTLICHVSNVFLVLKAPLSIIDAFSKSVAWFLRSLFSSHCGGLGPRRAASRDACVNSRGSEL